VNDSPIDKGFEYTVRLAVSIPLAWATLLKVTAENHYDYKCREIGKAGSINGLCNTACDTEYLSTMPLSWRDFDLIAKVAEQLRHHTEDFGLILKINGWIRASKDAITAQEKLCEELPNTRQWRQKEPA
jgi:hypothetical protein